MLRSAPPEKVSLPEVITAPLIASFALISSTIAPSSSITERSKTFIDFPGMSQVIVAMPSCVDVDVEVDVGHGRCSPVEIATTELSQPPEPQTARPRASGDPDLCRARP